MCTQESLSLGLVITLKVKEKWHVIFRSQFLNFLIVHKLKYLNIKECPIQFDLSILNEACPVLEEVDISGDSWVRAVSLKGLAKHQHL